MGNCTSNQTRDSEQRAPKPVVAILRPVVSRDQCLSGQEMAGDLVDKQQGLMLIYNNEINA